MEINQIEIGRVPSREWTEGSIPTIYRQLQDIRARAQEAGLGIVDADYEERGGSTQHRGDMMKHLRRVETSVETSAEDVQVPATRTWDKWSTNPSLPIVAKRATASQGLSKYLLENEEQKQRFIEWAQSERGTAAGIPTGEWIFQEFKECPGDRPASYRVMVDCTGDILASSLMYTHPNHPITQVQLGDRPNATRAIPEAPLEDWTDPRYLGARSIVSNRMFRNSSQMIRPKGSPQIVSVRDQIGGRVVLDRMENSHPIDEVDASVLTAHGLDAQNPRLPHDLRQQSGRIGELLGMEEGTIKALWLGLDFVQDGKGKKWYLEANYRPEAFAIRDYHGGMNKMTEGQAREWMLDRVFENIKRVRS